MDTTKWLKVGGMLCSVASVTVSIATAMISEKQTDAKIAEKVAEALAKETDK